MAISDANGKGKEHQDRLWLAAALEKLPIAIGLIDSDGRYIALSGSIKHLFGQVIPSRNPEVARQWQVFDDNGNRVDPDKWPSELSLRGDGSLHQMDGIYLEGSESERRVRLFSTPFIDSSGQSRGLVLMYDNELERRAQELRLGIAQQRFVATLIDTIRRVGAESDGDPARAHRMIARTMGFSEQSEERHDSLSPREEEVLRLMAWGNSRKDIGAQLGIAVKTVEFHRSSAVRKLDLKSRVDVVRYAVDRGWLRNSD